MSATRRICLLLLSAAVLCGCFLPAGAARRARQVSRENVILSMEDGDVQGSLSSPYTCLIYIERDIVHADTFLDYVRQYSPVTPNASPSSAYDAYGRVSTPLLSFLEQQCDDTVGCETVGSESSRSGTASCSPPSSVFAESTRQYCLPCAARSQQGLYNICQAARHTRFVPVRTFDEAINTTAGPVMTDKDYGVLLHPAFQAVPAPPSFPIPAAATHFDSVLPGPGTGAEHVYCFFIGTHPYLLSAVGTALTLVEHLHYGNFSFIFQSLATTAGEMLDYPFQSSISGGGLYFTSSPGSSDSSAESRTYTPFPPTVDLDSQTVLWELATERLSHEYLQEKLAAHNAGSKDQFTLQTPSEAARRPADQLQYARTSTAEVDSGEDAYLIFPLVYIDLDPLDYGYMHGIALWGMARNSSMAVIEWVGNDYSRTYGQGFSLALRTMCPSCSIVPVPLWRRFSPTPNSYPLVNLLKEIPRYIGRDPHSVLIPQMMLVTQTHKQLLIDAFREIQATGEAWDAIVFLNQLIKDYDESASLSGSSASVSAAPHNVTLTGPFTVFTDVLHGFSRQNLSMGVQRQELWYSHAVKGTIHLPEKLLLNGVLARAAIDRLVTDQVKFPYDWKSGFTVLDGSYGNVLPAPSGVRWSAPHSRVLTLSPYASLLVAYDLSQVAIFSPHRNRIMEIVDITVNASVAGRSSFAVAYHSATRTAYVLGGVTTSGVTSDGIFSMQLSSEVSDPQIDRLTPYCSEKAMPCLSQWNWNGSLPESLHGHAVAIDGDDVYVFGGVTEAKRRTRHLWRATVGKWDWQLMNTDGADPRTGQAALVYVNATGHRWLYFLGTEDSQYSSTGLLTYSVDDQTWSLLEHTGLPDSSVICMASVGTSVIAVSSTALYRYEPALQRTFSSRIPSFYITSTFSCSSVELLTELLTSPSHAYWRSASHTQNFLSNSTSLSPNATATTLSAPSDARPEQSASEPQRSVLLTAFASLASHMTFFGLPVNLTCSLAENHVKNNAGRTCVSCAAQYVSDGADCVPCAASSPDANPDYRVFCPAAPVSRSSLSETLAVAILVPVIIVLLLGLCIWACFLRSWLWPAELGHQRSRNAPISGPNCIAYFWIDAAPLLWRAQPNSMAETSSQLVLLVRSLLAAHDCYELLNCGDSGLYSARSPQQLLRAGTELWLQVSQRQWSVGRLSVNVILHYDHMQCTEWQASSGTHSGMEVFSLSKQLPTTLVSGSGIFRMHRCAIYVHGLVLTSAFGERLLAQDSQSTDKTSDGVVSHRELSTPSAKDGTNAVTPSSAGTVSPFSLSSLSRSPEHANLDKLPAPSPADGSLNPFATDYASGDLATARWHAAFTVSAAALGGQKRRLSLSRSAKAQSWSFAASKESAAHSPGASSPAAGPSTAAELVAVQPGDEVQVTYRTLPDYEVSPQHVQLPLHCVAVEARMEIRPPLCHAYSWSRLWRRGGATKPVSPASTTPASALLDRSCARCGRCIPRRTRCCKLRVLVPRHAERRGAPEEGTTASLPVVCPLYVLTANTHATTLAVLGTGVSPRHGARRGGGGDAREDRPSHVALSSRALVSSASAAGELGYLAASFSTTTTSSETSTDDAALVSLSMSRTTADPDVLLHPLVSTGLLPAPVFVHVVRIVEKLYEALMVPLRPDERLLVAESISKHLRLFTETFPDSHERGREVALRALQVVDMLHVKDLVDQIGDSHHH